MQQDNEKKFLENKAKLKWACRRGMLELDVLLGNFLEEAYSDLSLEEKKQFVTLLSHGDPSLFAWLLGHETPSDPELIAITDKIRRHAQSRTKT